MVTYHKRIWHKRVWQMLFGLSFLLLLAVAAHAGFIDDLKKAGEDTQKGFKQFGQDIKKTAETVKKSFSGSDSQADSAASLPSGVKSRLKKIDKELEKAEKALAQGADTAQVKARRAQRFLIKAQRLKGEIEKSYSGKFSPQHHAVKATYSRLSKVSEAIAQSLDEETPSAAATPSAKTAAQPVAKLPAGVTKRLRDINRELNNAERAIGREDAGNGRHYLKAAQTYMDEIKKGYKKYAADDFPEIRQAFERMSQVEQQVLALEKKAGIAKDEKEKTRQDKKALQANCEAWAAKLNVFTEGPEALYNYMTDDPDTLKKGKNNYDKAVQMRAELKQLNLPSGACSHLESTEKLLARYMQNFETHYGKHQEKMETAAAVKGVILFAKQPIDPANPQNITTAFNAGDYIYALIQTKKTFEESFKKEWIRIDVKINGKKIHAQFIKLHRPADRAKKTLVFEIAPMPNKMTAYSNPDVEYGSSKANMRQGPQEMTYHLSSLNPGKHTLSFVIGSYGKIYAQGEFTLQGDNYEFYAELHKKAKAAMSKSVSLPRAKMKNPGLASEMKALLQKAGQTSIHRLNIVDKDWWLDRVAGGDSAIKSRHIDAAVLAKDVQGYFYKKVRFQQDRLITGNWGRLYISHTFDRIDIPEANIDK